jgi:CheY-like chemotaxis protein
VTALDPRLLRKLARQHGVPAVDLDAVTIPLAVLRLVPEDVSRRLGLVPIEHDGAVLVVATATPGSGSALDELALRTGLRIVAYVADAAQIDRVLGDTLAARRRGERLWRGPRAPRGAEGLAGAVIRPDDDDGIPLIITPTTEPPLGAPPRPPTTPSPSPEESFDSVESSFRRGTPSDPLARARPRVLVVDDEPVIRQIFRQALLPRNLEVIEAGSGTEAIRLLKVKGPNVVILDAMLPDVHGFEICRRLRQSQRFAELPVVLVTGIYKGWRMAADARESLGVYAYLDKPVDLARLIAIVDDALAGRPAQPSPPEPPTGEPAQRLYAEASEAYRAGDLDSAIAQMASAVALEPLSASLRHQLGLLFAQRGHDFQAIHELEAAIDIDPSRFHTLKNLAILFQRHGFRRKACELWERALTAAPDESARAETREILRQLI